MKRKIFIAGLFLGGLTASQLSAQKYLGLSHSNYSGVYGSQYNPAKLPDEKVKFAFNLVSANAMVDNNLYRFKGIDDLNDFDLFFGRVKSTVGIGITGVKIGTITELLGPSAQFTTSNRLGFGLSTRARVFAQGNNLKDDFLNALARNLNSNQTIRDPEGFSTGANLFADVGVKGGYTVIDDSDVRLSLGASVKYYRGAAMNNFVSGGHIINYVHNNAFPSQSTIDIFFSDWTFQSNINGDFNSIGNNLFSGNNYGSGIGGDFGAELVLKNNSSNKPYNFKFGAAIHDVGSIKYKNVTTLNIKGVATGVDPSRIELFDIESTAQYLGAFPLMNVVRTTGDVKQSLPTNLDIYADYAITDKFFVTANGLVNLAKTNSTNPYYYNYVGLTPRFETKWIDVAVPISYNFMSEDIKPGLALRLGPLSVGTDDIKFIFTEAKGANVYAGLGFLLYKGKKAVKQELNPDKDSDHDGILDRDDKCPYQAGPKENDGCPWGDKDNDGVIDKDDKCPDVAGPKENDGCPWPDTDGDGMLDKDDKCPTEPGLPEYLGCPKPHSAIAEEVTMALKDILFNFGKATLRPESTPKLDEAAKIIKASNGGTFLLVGHTDKKGNAASNLRISKQRAAAVVSALEERGVNPAQLKSKGVGSAEAKVPVTASDEDRLQDRRVEVKYISGADWDALAKSDVASGATVKKATKKGGKKAPVKRATTKKRR